MPQLVKNLPAMQEPWVRSLGQEDPLKKRMATYMSIAWITHGRSLVGYSPKSFMESGMTEHGTAAQEVKGK